MNLETDYKRLAREVVAYMEEHGAKVRQAVEACDRDEWPKDTQIILACLTQLQRELDKLRDELRL